LAQQNLGALTNWGTLHKNATPWLRTCMFDETASKAQIQNLWRKMWGGHGTLYPHRLKSGEAHPHVPHLIASMQCWTRQPAKSNMLGEFLRQECHCTCHRLSKTDN